MSQTSYLTDHATQDDLLDYEHFQQVLYNVVTKAETPLTIGVFGPWGSGVGVAAGVGSSIDTGGSPRHCRTEMASQITIRERIVAVMGLIRALLYNATGSPCKVWLRPVPGGRQPTVARSPSPAGFSRLPAPQGAATLAHSVRLLRHGRGGCGLHPAARAAPAHEFGRSRFTLPVQPFLGSSGTAMPYLNPNRLAPPTTMNDVSN